MVEKAAPHSAAEQRLQASLGKMMNTGGAAGGALVYDLDSQAKLYARRPDIGRPPASVEKLYTTVALMRIMGTQARLHTTVLGIGHLDHGVWHGNLYLRGGGDPTFGDAGFNRIWEQGYGPTASQLVAQLVRLGIKRVTGQVYADESLFDPKRGGLMTNYAVDIPDFGGQLSALTFDHGADLHRLPPAIFAVRQFVSTMRGALIAARAARHTAETPVDARELAVVSSPPLSVMTRLMDVPSDDLYAEMFTKQLGRPVRKRRFDLGRRAGDQGHDGVGLRDPPSDPRRLGAVTQRPLLAAGGGRPPASGLATRRWATCSTPRCRSSASRAPCRRSGSRRPQPDAASPRPAR